MEWVPFCKHKGDNPYKKLILELNHSIALSSFLAFADIFKHQVVRAIDNSKRKKVNIQNILLSSVYTTFDLSMYIYITFDLYKSLLNHFVVTLKNMK